MTEELHLHLLELARAEGEVAGGDLVAEALAHLGDAERDPHPLRVEHVLEVHEHPLGRLGTQERGIFGPPQGPDGGLEHQVEFARLGHRAGLRRPGSHHVGEVIFGGDAHQAGGLPGQGGLGILAAHVEELARLDDRVFEPRLGGVGIGHDEVAMDPAGVFLDVHPAAPDLVEAEPPLGFTAVGHHVVEQVIVPRALPDLGMHDQRAVEPNHRERRGGPGRGRELVVVGDHVAPPRLLHVALEFDPQGAVVPKAVQPAVDLG